jgi:hypothetical protein
MYRMPLLAAAMIAVAGGSTLDRLGIAFRDPSPTPSKEKQ